MKPAKSIPPTERCGYCFAEYQYHSKKRHAFVERLMTPPGFVDDDWEDDPAFREPADAAESKKGKAEPAKSGADGVTK